MVRPWSHHPGNPPSHSATECPCPSPDTAEIHQWRCTPDKRNMVFQGFSRDMMNPSKETLVHGTGSWIPWAVYISPFQDVQSIFSPHLSYCVMFINRLISRGAKGAETWVSDVAPGLGGAATLRRSGGARVALRRCDPARGRRRCDAATLRRWHAAVGPVRLRRTLRRCWRWDAATLRRGSDAATLLALWRCDAESTLRRCWHGDAATLLTLKETLKIP